MNALPPPVSLPSLGGFLEQQRAKRQQTPAPPTPAPAADTEKSARAAPKQRTARPATPAAVGRHSASSGESVKTSLNLSLSAQQQLRDLAAQQGISQGDALVLALGELTEGPARDTISKGDFAVAAPQPSEIRVIVTVRVSRANLDAMNRLQQRLGYDSRSDMAVRALTP